MSKRLVGGASAILAIVLAALTLGATSEAEAYKQKELARYTRTGKLETCIPLGSIESTKILDDKNILFLTDGGGAYLNELPDRCGPMDRYKAITYDTSLFKLCNTDVVNVMDFNSSVPKLGTCGLGQFEKLTPVKRSAK